MKDILKYFLIGLPVMIILSALVVSGWIFAVLLVSMVIVATVGIGVAVHMIISIITSDV
jgi:hypothetical protein